MKRLSLLLLFAALPVFPSARLTYNLASGPVAVSWPATAFPLNYSVDQKVADAITAGAIDRAFDAWKMVPDTSLSFRSNGVVSGLNPGHDGQNSVSFVDDLFRDQHFLALTTNWYDDTGRLTEADIQIDPTASTQGYNIALLIEHEVGHFLGLDHSAVVSAVMYPFVGKGGSTDLDSDDRLAIAQIYPRVDPMAGATIKGHVNGNQGGIFAAQVVALNQQGQPIGTALTDSAGNYEIQGLPSGSYRIYAEPLDGPVVAANLSGIWRAASSASFPTRFASGSSMAVQNGRIYGNVDVDSTGTDATLNPKWVGGFPDGSSDVMLSATPVLLRPGQNLDIAVGGDGFTSGMTKFEVLNSEVKRISDFHYAGNYVYALFAVSPKVTAGSAVIQVTSGTQTAMLTGGLIVQSMGRGRAAAH